MTSAVPQPYESYKPLFSRAVQANAQISAVIDVVIAIDIVIIFCVGGQCRCKLPLQMASHVSVAILAQAAPLGLMVWDTPCYVVMVWQPWGGRGDAAQRQDLSLPESEDKGKRT